MPQTLRGSAELPKLLTGREVDIGDDILTADQVTGRSGASLNRNVGRLWAIVRTGTGNVGVCQRRYEGNQ